MIYTYHIIVRNKITGRLVAEYESLTKNEVYEVRNQIWWKPWLFIDVVSAKRSWNK